MRYKLRQKKRRIQFFCYLCSTQKKEFIVVPMKEITITSTVKVLNFDELEEQDQRLINAAKVASVNSYAIYSHFKVGAALLLANGVVVTGNNQENAAYPSGLCAERTTVFYANAQYPEVPVLCLAIAAQNEKGFIDRPISPCGACRQVLLEAEKRFNHPIRIILFGKKDTYVIEEGIKALLPLCFDSDYLE